MDKWKNWEQKLMKQSIQNIPTVWQRGWRNQKPILYWDTGLPDPKQSLRPGDILFEEMKRLGAFGCA